MGAAEGWAQGQSVLSRRPNRTPGREPRRSADTGCSMVSARGLQHWCSASAGQKALLFLAAWRCMAQGAAAAKSTARARYCNGYRGRHGIRGGQGTGTSERGGRGGGIYHEAEPVGRIMSTVAEQ